MTMKKITVFLISALFLLVFTGGVVVFARGMSCHGSKGRHEMMMNDGGSHHRSGFMQKMHRLHRKLSNWWNDSSYGREQSGSDSSRTDKASSGSNSERGKTEVQFTLRTKLTSGMAYEGVSDPIRNDINPTLRVRRGDTVNIKLINSMGGVHDLAIPALDVGSTNLTNRGDTDTIQFVPQKAGEFAYYCTIPGHRSSGMEGTIVVEKRRKKNDGK